MDRAAKYNDKMSKRYQEYVLPRTHARRAQFLLPLRADSWAALPSLYNRSPFGGVDLWLILGLAAFIIPFGGLALGLATGAIHTPAQY